MVTVTITDTEYLFQQDLLKRMKNQSQPCYYRQFDQRQFDAKVLKRLPIIVCSTQSVATIRCD
jgi:hypothetical protein